MIRRSALLASLVAVFAVSHAPQNADAAAAPGGELPAGWVGDFGTPVAWQDTTIWLFADINDGHGRFARNAVVVDGEFMIQPLRSTADSFYWPTDGVELADGSLLVVALEVINRPDLANDGWAFEVVDTDAFVVREPDVAASWKWASKIDVGPWGLRQVEFLDQYDMVVAKDVYGSETELYSFDPADPAVWVELASDFPTSGGPFTPVQTADGWFGYSWDWAANTATLWSTDSLDAGWVEVSTSTSVEQTHAHGLSVVDGVVWHRWSVFTQRVAYEPFSVEGL